MSVKIVTICGSSRFVGESAVKAWELNKQGIATFHMPLLPQWYPGVREHHQGETENVAATLDNLWLELIAMSDEIFVINCNGYIGERTRIEINHALKLGKPVRYLMEQNDQSDPSVGISAGPKESTVEGALAAMKTIVENFTPPGYTVRETPNDQADPLARSNKKEQGHAGDCTIYASLINGTPLDGICTCGYGWECVRHGDWDQMFSAEWLEVNKRPEKKYEQACLPKAS